jgi:hypothetical protein
MVPSPTGRVSFYTCCANRSNSIRCCGRVVVALLQCDGAVASTVAVQLLLACVLRSSPSSNDLLLRDSCAVQAAPSCSLAASYMSFHCRAGCGGVAAGKPLSVAGDPSQPGVRDGQRLRPRGHKLCRLPQPSGEHTPCVLISRRLTALVTALRMSNDALVRLLQSAAWYEVLPKQAIQQASPHYALPSLPSYNDIHLALRSTLHSGPHRTLASGRWAAAWAAS